MEYVEKHCNNIVEELVRKYKTIPQLLGKIEGIIEHKNTLKSPKMRSYYRFWERRIFNALNRVFINFIIEYLLIICRWFYVIYLHYNI